VPAVCVVCVGRGGEERVAGAQRGRGLGLRDGEGGLQLLHRPPSIRTLVSRHSPGLRAWQSEYNNSGPHSSLEQQPPADRGIGGYFIPGRNRLRDERFALTYFVGRTISST
jgi:hypothetical protein